MLGVHGKICLAPCAVRHDKKPSLVKGNKRQLEIFDATDKDLVRVKISRDEQNKYVKKGTLLPFVDPEQGEKDLGRAATLCTLLLRNLRMEGSLSCRSISRL